MHIWRNRRPNRIADNAKDPGIFVEFLNPIDISQILSRYLPIRRFLSRVQRCVGQKRPVSKAENTRPLPCVAHCDRDDLLTAFFCFLDQVPDVDRVHNVGRLYGELNNVRTRYGKPLKDSVEISRNVFEIMI